MSQLEVIVCRVSVLLLAVCSVGELVVFVYLFWCLLMAAVGEWFCYLFLTFAGQYVFKYIMIITEWENNWGTGNIFPIQTIPFSVSHPNLLRDIWLNHTNMNWLWFPNPSLSLSMRTVVQYNIRILVLCDKEVASSSPKYNHFMQLYGRVGVSKFLFLWPTWLFTMWLGDEKVRGEMSRMKILGEWTFPLFGKERGSGENGKQDENFPYWPTIFARCISGENGDKICWKFLGFLVLPIFP